MNDDAIGLTNYIKKIYDSNFKNSEEKEENYKMAKEFKVALSNLCTEICCLIINDLNKKKIKKVDTELTQNILQKYVPDNEFFKEGMKISFGKADEFLEFEKKKTENKKNGIKNDDNKKKKTTVSENCSLILPTARIRKFIKEYYNGTLVKTIPIYITCLLEYCVTNILEDCLEEMKNSKAKLINVDIFKQVVKEDKYPKFFEDSL